MTRMRLPAQYKPAVPISADSEVVANVYDTRGRVSSQTDPTGAMTTFDYATVPGSTIVTEPATTDAAGNPVTHVRLDTYTNGLLSAQTLGYGTASASTWRREYDPATLGCTKVTDPNNHVWLATYDPAGNRTSATDPLGNTTRWTYNAHNLMLTMVDPRGGNLAPVGQALWTTTNFYDDAGCACNLQRSEHPLLNATATAVIATQIVRYRYGERGNQPSEVTTVVDPDGFEWQSDYDAAGNLAALTAPATPENPAGNRTTLVTDARGNLLSVTSPRGTLTPASGDFTTTFAYDDAGRRTRARDPLWSAASPAAHQRSFTYDANGNLKTATDGMGRTTSYEYDAADRPRFVTRPDTTRTETRWWPNGSLKAQLDAAQSAGGGAGTRYFPDAQGRLATVIDPLGRASAYGYDPAGNRTATQDPGGNCGAVPKVGCTTFGYDNADRLASIDYSDPGTPDVGLIGYDAGGRRTVLNDSTRSSAWSYDSLGRMVSSTDGPDTMGYHFDLRGNLSSLDYPVAGHTVTRIHDDAGRLGSVRDWNAKTTTFSYNPDSQLVTTTFPNGVVTTATPDDDGALTAIADTKGAATLASFAYGRDADDQVASIDETGVPTTGPQVLAYDPNGRLASTGAQAFAHDPADDLVRLGGRTQSFDAAHQLCWAATAPASATPTCAAPPLASPRFGYDTRGNRTSAAPGAGAGTAMSYGYDQADRLITVSATASQNTLATGTVHSLVQRPGGTVQGWGMNWHGQLGNGTTAPSTTPVTVAGLSDVVALDGAGDAPGGQQGMQTSVALRADGTVWAWGMGYYGQLGNGAPDDVATPVQVTMADGQPLTGAVAVASGTAQSFAVRADATVWGWGYNSNGALGDGTRTVKRLRAVQVRNGDGSPFTGAVSIASSVDVTVAAKADGSVWDWSINHPPAPVPGLAGVVSVVPTDWFGHFGAVTRTGTASTWSTDRSGTSTVPAVVAGLPAVTQVVGGSGFFLALAADGHVWGWGRNDYGQLGNGTTADAATPVQVSGLSGVTAIAAGMAHGLATRTDGSVWSWGSNTIGQLGNGTTSSTPVTTPAQVSGLGPQPLGTVATYAYRGDGLRLSKTVGGGATTRQVWDQAEGLPLLATDGASSYLTGPGGTPFARIDAAGATTYLHTDELGSVRLLTNAAGSVLATRTYDAYGKTVATTGSFDTPLGYAGQYADAESGLIYMRARYYDPATGQFMTRDPLEGLTGEAYGYVGGNPITGTDPSGLLPVPLLAALEAVMGEPVVVGLIAGALGSFVNQMILARGDITKVDVLSLLITAGVGGASVLIPCGPVCVGAASGGLADVIAQLSNGEWSGSELLAAIVLGGFFGNYAGRQMSTVPGGWSVQVRQVVELGLAVLGGTLDVSGILSKIWKPEPAGASVLVC